MKLKMKTRSHRYDLNRPKLRQRHKYSKYEKCVSMIMLYVLNNTSATFETQFMKKLSNTKTELKKKNVAYKKACISSKSYNQSQNLGIFILRYTCIFLAHICLVIR